MTKFLFWIVVVAFGFTLRKDQRIRVERIENSRGISIKKFDDLKVKIKEGYDYTPCLNAALDEVKIRGGVVKIPKGEFFIGSINRSDLNNVKIIGAGTKETLINKLNVRGHVFTINDCDNFELKDMSIDCKKASFEGGVWYGGMRKSIVKNVVVKNSDYTSIVIAGKGVSGGSRMAYDNLVINCEVYGQRRYHPTGTSPLIAGDGAIKTTFRNCIVVDCKGDAFDSDNAPSTKFIGCKAINKKGISPFCAFWSEGQENIEYHHVVWENCYAENYTSAFGISENVQGTIISGKAVRCQKAVVGLNNRYRIYVKGFSAFECGKGIERDDTKAVFLFTNCVTLENVNTENTIAKNSFCNYSLKFKTESPTYINSCKFDKQVYVSYTGTGSQDIRLKNVTLVDTALKYYKGNSTKLHIEKCQFINSYISGSYIKRNTIKNSIFTDSTGTLTAISTTGDNNTLFVDCKFDGFYRVSSNAQSIGRNNKYTNINKKNYIN